MRFKNEIMGGLLLWLAWLLMGKGPPPGGNGGTPPGPTIYTCPTCGQTFTDQAAYLAHLQSHETPPYEPTPVYYDFICPYCGQVFGGGQEMLVAWQSHVRTHLAPGEYVNAVYLQTYRGFRIYYIWIGSATSPKIPILYMAGKQGAAEMSWYASNLPEIMQHIDDYWTLYGA